MQCPYLVYRLTTTSAARRARSKLACCAASRETVSRVAGSRVPREHRVILGDRGWYVALWPRAEGEGPLVSAVSLPSAWLDRNQRGTSRARRKRACCASSRETVSAAARLHVPREHRLILGGRSWYVAPRPRAEGERPLVGVIPLPSASTDINQRDTARAQQACVLRCARETVSAAARSRVPREHRLILGGRTW